MLSEFEKKLTCFINTNDLFFSEEKILLAVSGGADSTALMYAMHALKTENVINNELHCAHINHQLRGQGDLDEEFVVTQAKKLKLTVTTGRIDVRGFARLNKLSIETAARQLRMEALIDIARANNCNRIVTAHQKNDNAETIIQRLSRGTGFRGLGGIWPERVFANGIKFVRPLLCFRRDEVIGYLQMRNLKWCRDHTNDDCTFRRNFIRHRLMPALQHDCSDSIVEQLSHLAQSARRYYKIVCKRADELWPDTATCDGDKSVLDIKLFGSEPLPVKVELIRRSLKSISCGERYITQQHYEGIMQLIEHNITGKKIVLPGGCEVLREYGSLVFSSRRVGPALSEAEWAAQPVLSITLEVPGQITFEHFFMHATVSEKNEIDFERFKVAKTCLIEWFDLDKIKPPLYVRLRQAGDKFVPLGHSREKKLGKFLTAQRVPNEIRRNVLVVADREKIIWVWPVRISEQSKFSSETQRIVQLQIIDLDAANRNGEINEQ